MTPKAAASDSVFPVEAWGSRANAARGACGNGSRYAAAALVVGLTFVCFGLGSYDLGGPGLDFDEGFSAMVAQMGVRDGIAYLVAWDAHPPLHYLLLHFWMRLAGDSEFAMRSVSVAGATVIVPLAYQTGRAILGKELGIFAAFIVSSNAFLISHAHQARMYSLATASSLLVVCLMIRSLRRGERAKFGEWLLLVVGVSTCIYTLYYTVFVLAFVAVAMLFWGWMSECSLSARIRLLRPYLAAALVAGLLLAPWVPSAIAQASLTGPGAWRAFVAAPMMVQRTWETFSVGLSAVRPNDPFLEFLAAAFAALCVYGVGQNVVLGLRAQKLQPAERNALMPDGADPAHHYATRHAFASAICVAYLLVPLVVIQVISHRQPVFHERYMVVLLPAFALLMGLGLTAVRRAGILPLVVALLLVAGGQSYLLVDFFRDPRSGRDDFRGMVEYVNANLRPGDVIVLSSGASWPIFQHYFSGNLAWRGQLQEYEPPTKRAMEPVLLQVGSISSSPGLRLSTPEDEPQTPEEAEANLDRAVAGFLRVWYFKSFETITDSGGVVDTWLSRNLVETQNHWFAGSAFLQLRSYSTWRPSRDDRASSSIPVDAKLTSNASVFAYEQLPVDPQPGNVALISVYWQARAAIGAEYQVFAHLVDRDGRLWAQFDGPPLQGRYPTTRWRPGETIRDDYAVSIPATIPVGVYHFELGMYDLTNQQRVALAGDGDRNSFPVGRVVVRQQAPTDSCGEYQRLATKGPIALRCGRILQTEVHPGNQVEVALTWESLDGPVADYSVFVHLLDRQGRIVGQSDGEPLEGRLPTGVWRPGDVVDDRHILRIGSDIKAGDYRVVVGMYQPISMQRLPIDGSADSVVQVGSITVLE